MNMVFLKRALGLASAMVLMGALALAASPVQASDVDARIQVLEQELAQLKQNQEAANERALAAEMKGPSFNYRAGRGLTIAAADNNWSITFGQRLQIYTSLWLTNDNPERGYQNGVLRVRRFRPHINVASQQGFYRVNWQFNGDTSVAFNGDGYIHFEQMSPYLPTVGYGYNPSFGGNSGAGFGRTEESMFVNALGMGGSQDSSVVLSWSTLPAMGIARISYFGIAMGHDEQAEYERHPPTGHEGREKGPHGRGTDGRSTAIAFSIQPVANAKEMGGFDISSLQYSFTWESMDDLGTGPDTIGVGPATTQNSVTLINIAGEEGDGVEGDHKYTYHSLSWSPLGWFQLGAHHASYKADATAGPAHDTKATEIALGARIWVWSPRDGILSGSRTAGGIYIAPKFSVTDADFINRDGMEVDAEATNHGVSVNYNVPGGWMQIRGVWDRLDCEGNGCNTATIAHVADEGENDFDVFTLIVEYRF